MNASVHHCHTHGHSSWNVALDAAFDNVDDTGRDDGPSRWGGSHAGLFRRMQDVADYKAGLHAFSVDTPGKLRWRRCYATSHTPGPDFSVTVSPVSASAVLGNPTSAVMISVAPEHGFNASVDMSLQGLPQGVDAAPPSFSLTPGASQSITFSVSPSAAVGVFPITVLGSSGNLSHSASMTVNTEPVASVRTFQSGSLLYLESSSGADVSRVGMQTAWGGSIVEVSVNGENFVNAHDAGREVQLAQFDHDNLDWNPTLGGDIYNHGSPILAQTVTRDSIYIKTQGYNFSPEPFGGGPAQPVLQDTYAEMTLAAVPDHAFTFKLHMKFNLRFLAWMLGSRGTLHWGSF